MGFIIEFWKNRVLYFVRVYKCDSNILASSMNPTQKKAEGITLEVSPSIINNLFAQTCVLSCSPPRTSQAEVVIVEDHYNSEGNNVTDGQAEIGYKLGQARDGCPCNMHTHTMPHPLLYKYPCVEHRTLGKHVAVNAGSGAHQRRCGRPPAGWQNLLSGAAVSRRFARNCHWSAHPGQGLACRQRGRGISCRICRLGHIHINSSVMPKT